MVYKRRDLDRLKQRQPRRDDRDVTTMTTTNASGGVRKVTKPAFTWILINISLFPREMHAKVQYSFKNLLE